MEEMQKSFEQKLAEQQAHDAEEDAKKAEIAAAKASGRP